MNNFIKRLISGVVLLVMATASFYMGGSVLKILLALLSVQAYRELLKAMNSEGRVISQEDVELKEELARKKTLHHYLTWMGIPFIVLYYILLGSNWIPVGISISGFLMFMTVYSITFPRYGINDIFSACFSYIYGPVMMSFIYLCRDLSIGLSLVWFILICSWGSDTCAYCVGILFGKHKMAPLLSPKKTIEGAIGGILGCAGIGTLYGYYLVNREVIGSGSLPMVTLICILGALISMMGDLSASAIKRDHGIKDYSNLIPGHGGVMDRFDSVIFVAPIIYFMGKYFLMQI